MQAAGKEFKAGASRGRPFEDFWKGGKTRYIPLHPVPGGLILDYMEESGHGNDLGDPLFRPIRNNRTGTLVKAITEDMIYKLVRLFGSAAIQDWGPMR
jgi:hypothetical protein